MRNCIFYAIVLLSALLCDEPMTSGQSLNGQQVLEMLKTSADKSTLDQEKTHPFHLHASVAPTSERDNDTGWTGEIDIWWKAPGVYRRELRSTGFHMVEIVSAGRVWQRAEGDYLPYWIDRASDAFLHPLPPYSLARKGVVPDKGRAMMGSLYLHWEKPLPMDLQLSKENVAITEKSGLLFYDGGLGWEDSLRTIRTFTGGWFHTSSPSEVLR